MLRSRLVVASALLCSLAVAQAPANTPEREKRELARLERVYQTAKKEWQAAKSNATKRKAYIDATVRLGTASMNAITLEPRVKYPRALRLYREVLAIDPKNKEAKDNKKMIEDIYRSMGRPIPK